MRLRGMQVLGERTTSGARFIGNAIQVFALGKKNSFMLALMKESALVSGGWLCNVSSKPRGNDVTKHLEED